MFRVVTTILAGRTPEPGLMQTCGWWLIAACVLPTVLTDLHALLKSSTAQEKEERERLRRKLRHKLDRLIENARVRLMSELPITKTSSSPSAPGVAEFYTVVADHIGRVNTNEQQDDASFSKVDVQPTKTDVVEPAFNAVAKFEARADPRFAAGLLIFAEACCYELGYAIAQTAGGQDEEREGGSGSERYGDGQELEKINISAKACLKAVNGAVGLMAVRGAAATDRPALLAARLALRAQIAAAKPVLTQIYIGDRKKLLTLLWMGREQFPFLAAASAFKILSGAVSTMARMQFLEITKLFNGDAPSMFKLRQLIGNMMMTRLLQIAVARVETKLTENGVQ